MRHICIHLALYAFAHLSFPPFIYLLPFFPPSLTHSLTHSLPYLLCSHVSDVSDFNHSIFARSSPAVLAKACSKISKIEGNKKLKGKVKEEGEIWKKMIEIIEIGIGIETEQGESEVV